MGQAPSRHHARAGLDPAARSLAGLVPAALQPVTSPSARSRATERSTCRRTDPSRTRACFNLSVLVGCINFSLQNGTRRNGQSASVPAPAAGWGRDVGTEGGRASCSHYRCAGGTGQQGSPAGPGSSPPGRGQLGVGGREPGSQLCQGLWEHGPDPAPRSQTGCQGPTRPQLAAKGRRLVPVPWGGSALGRRLVTTQASHGGTETGCGVVASLPVPRSPRVQLITPNTCPRPFFSN